MMPNIKVILVRAQRAGNVGLVARAMKNTGLLRLVMVKSNKHRSKTALTFGAPAKEVLESAAACGDLGKAIQNSTYTVGFTRREGKMRLSLLSFLDLVGGILSKARNGEVCLVFGNERTGLLTDEISQCDVAAYLPSNPNFPSMNLSHAVMLVGYELLKASMTKDRLGGIRALKLEKYPTRRQVEDMFKEIEGVLKRLNYRDLPRLELLSSIMHNLRRMAKRVMPTVAELNMIRGILSRVDQRIFRR